MHCKTVTSSCQQLVIYDTGVLPWLLVHIVCYTVVLLFTFSCLRWHTWTSSIQIFNWMLYPLNQALLLFSSCSQTGYTFTCAEQNKQCSRIVAIVGVMNIWVARAHAKTHCELAKQTQNKVNQSATTSKFPCLSSNHFMLLHSLLHQQRDWLSIGKWNYAALE